MVIRLRKCAKMQNDSFKIKLNGNTKFKFCVEKTMFYNEQKNNMHFHTNSLSSN